MLASRRNHTFVKLNILSDLHLSSGALTRPENDADVAILAGDIARRGMQLPGHQALPYR
jgi:hypothetical protein